MPDVPVRLRPIEETDLELLSRFDTDPAASQPFEWTGFPDTHARRRRWEKDGFIGGDSTQLAVVLPRRDPGRDRGLARRQGRRP